MNKYGNSLLFSSLFSCLISNNTVDSQATWKILQILIVRSRLICDLDLHCFLKRIYES